MQGPGQSDVMGRTGSMPHLNGGALMNPDDSAPSAYNMGISNGSFGPQDLDRLRNFPASLFDQRNPALASQVLEGIRKNGLGDPPQLEPWSASLPAQAHGKV